MYNSERAVNFYTYIFTFRYELNKIDFNISNFILLQKKKIELKSEITIFIDVKNFFNSLDVLLHKNL